MTKVLTVIGARPQFIKASVVSRAFNSHSSLSEIIIHTGQHYDTNMSSIFFNEMQIPTPTYQFNVKGEDHGSMTGNMMIDIEGVLKKEKPDAVIVYGDTNSTLAGAIVSKKMNIPLFHIEAGLRSHNLDMPEEINRIMTDRISDICFCPTQLACNNLDQENSQSKIFLVGDVMYDATLYYAPLCEKKSMIMNTLNLNPNNFFLATVHRAENTNSKKRLSSIFNALDQLNKEKKVVLPLHPRTKKLMNKYGIKTDVLIVDPVGYFDMQVLLKNCSIILTDSGGIQKESYFHNKFCITLREETEWLELVDGEFNFLAGSNPNLIIESYEKIKSLSFSTKKQLYGNGDSANLILSKIVEYFK